MGAVRYVTQNRELVDFDEALTPARGGFTANTVVLRIVVDDAEPPHERVHLWAVPGLLVTATALEQARREQPAEPAARKAVRPLSGLRRTTP